MGTSFLLGIGPSTADVFHGYWIYGKIHEEYTQAGGFNFFGNATTIESNTQNGGKYQKFANNSSIYWHEGVSGGHANQIGGAIRDAWGRVGWETGYLGYPITREFGVSGGRANHMQAGSIYWSPASGAQNVWVGIRDRWAADGYETGKWGFPTQDTRTTTCSVWAQDFQGGTVIYKSGNTPSGVPYNDYYFMGNDSVSNGKISYQILDAGFPYSSEFAYSVSLWNQLDPIEVRPRVAGELPDLNVSSIPDPDFPYYGLWSPNPFGLPDDLIYGLDSLSTQTSEFIRYTGTHELGHAMGVNHTCSGDLMKSGSVGGVAAQTPTTGLTRDIYHNLWGF
jgi:LGFP repeat